MNVVLKVVEIKASRQYGQLSVTTNPLNLYFDCFLDDILGEEKEDGSIVVQEEGLEVILNAVLRRLDEKPEKDF